MDSFVVLDKKSVIAYGPHAAAAQVRVQLDIQRPMAGLIVHAEGCALLFQTAVDVGFCRTASANLCKLTLPGSCRPPERSVADHMMLPAG